LIDEAIIGHVTEIGLITDPAIAKAEAQFVRDEASYFKFLYSNRIKSDTQALQVGSDFVDELKVGHPKEYQLGVKTGDIYNEIRHDIPDNSKFDAIWKEFYATHMQINLAEMGKRRLVKKSSEKKWQEAAGKLANNPQYQDVTAETWNKIVRFATSGEELKQKLRALNLEPKIE